MAEIICSRSGLPFYAETRRKKVHPEISRYSSHKDTNIRYLAIAVIDRGKAEGWDSLEKFESEIDKALNPPAPPPIDYDFEGYWAAAITGYSERFGLERDFLKPVEKEGRFKRYRLERDGLYETCYRSNKGNDTRKFWQVSGSEMEEIDLEQVETVLGQRPEATEPPAKSGKPITTDKPLGQVGDTVQLDDGSWVAVTAVDHTVSYQDDDGIGWDHYPSGANYVFEVHTYKTWFVPATDEQIEQAQSEIAQRQAAQAAVCRLNEIALADERTKPETANPSGLKIGFRDKALSYDSPYLQIDYQQRLLWTVIYNWRDGDLWALNNLGGHSIATSQLLTPELEAELAELIEAIQALYPDAVEQSVLEQRKG